MRDKSELTDLFKDRLTQTELEVRDGFWEALERDLAVPAPVGKKVYALPRRMTRWIAAASVLLGLGIVAAVWWKPAPQEGNEAVRRLASVEAQEPENVVPDAPSLPVRPLVEPGRSGGNYRTAWTNAVAQAESSDGDPVSVHVSITITQRQYGHPQARRRTDNSMFHAGGGYYGTGDGASWTASRGEEPSVEDCGTLLKDSRWALKAGVGTSLPKGDFRAPLTAGLSVERRLNKRLSLEAGVQYTRLAEDGGETLHTLGIPVRLNVLLAGNDKVDFYALAGGAVEKCGAGAPDNSFDAEPVQCSVMGGLGVRYKMNDRLALFAEPTVSHHFDSDASTQSLRTERPTNLNLLCGLRMAF